MPPSPSSRRSPGRELGKGRSHRRGHSLESRLLIKAKDDDLVLFNEMQKHETDKFLLHTSDNFDESISKLRYISDFKLGIAIPTRGENNDLLHIAGDKNDYDWLLTPPDTPLFPSLDDDESPPIDTFRGRTRKPMSLSRPYMAFETQRTSRSSASPHRLSSSPQSRYGVIQPAARPSSAPRSSSPPVIRQRAPLRRPSTPPTKPSTPTLKPSAPTFWRISSGPSGQAFSSSRRGTSPIKGNRRGYSASPKSRAWQSNLPGFSMDAPPNLRTSLSDQSASRAWGSSPASRNSVDSSSKIGRQSISPSASRSARSSLSHERQEFISCSKTSAASSGDDGADSVLFIAVEVSDGTAVRKYGPSANNRAMTFYEKASRLPSASTGPRASFDSVDHQKTPQNMFSTLLSRVPATTFDVGKTNSVPGSMLSRNLSNTTGGKSSSESALNFAPDVEDSSLHQSDLAGEWEKIKNPETQEEVLIFNEFDQISDDNIHSGTTDFDEEMENRVDLQKLQSSAGNIGNAVNTTPALQSSHISEHSESDCNGIFITCLKCGKHIIIMNVHGPKDVCQECAAIDELLDSREQVASDKTPYESGKDLPDSRGSKVHVQTGMAEVSEQSSSEHMHGHHERSREQESDIFPDNNPSLLATGVGDDHLSEHVTDSLMDIGNQQLSEKLMDYLNEESDPEANGGCMPKQSNPSVDSSLAFDNTEGMDVSGLLMQQSISSKWPVVQGRAFSDMSIICSRPSYERDNLSGMRCSIDRESSSASSVDLVSSGQTDVASKKTDICAQCQLSSRKDEMDNVRSSCNMNAESPDSHSEASISVTEASTHSSSESEEVFCRIIESGYNEDIHKTLVETAKHENTNKDTNLIVAESTSTEKAVVGQYMSVCTGISVASDASYASYWQMVRPEFCFQLQDTPVSDNLNAENCTSSEKASEVLFQNNRAGVLAVEIEVPLTASNSSFIEDNCMLNHIGCRDNILNATANRSSNLILEQQICDCIQDSQNEHAHVEIPNDTGDVLEGFFLTKSEKDALISASQSNCAEPPCIEAPRSTQRTFTLEEATDTIIFCSSILHDVAYKAATIGMQKEMGSHQTVTCLAKSVSNQKNFQTISNKGIQNSGKFKREKMEIDTKKPCMDLANNVRIPELVSSNAEVSQMVDSMKHPKLKLKCNCTVM